MRAVMHACCVQDFGDVRRDACRDACMLRAGFRRCIVSVSDVLVHVRT